MKKLNNSYASPQENQCKDPLFQEITEKLAALLETSCLYYNLHKKPNKTENEENTHGAGFANKTKSDKQLLLKVF